MKLNKKIISTLVIVFSILIGFFEILRLWENNISNKEKSIITTSLMISEDIYDKDKVINPLSINKTAKPIKGQGDNNEERKYTISLNATYNGIEESMENKPKDIILILDKSSSMVWNMNYLPINRIIKCNNEQEVYKVIDDYIYEKYKNDYDFYINMYNKLYKEGTFENTAMKAINKKYGKPIENNGKDIYTYYYEKIGEEIWKRSSGVNLIKAVKSFSDTVLSQKGNEINLIEFSQQISNIDYMYKYYGYYHGKGVIFLTKDNSIGDVYSYNSKLIKGSVSISEISNLNRGKCEYVSDYEGEKIIVKPWSSEEYRDEYNIYTRGDVYDLYGNSKSKVINIRQNIRENTWCINEGTIKDAKCSGRDVKEKKDIYKILEDFQWGGGTDTQSCIRVLGEELKRLKAKNNNKSKYVIFFTDGIPTGRLYKTMYPEDNEPKDLNPCILSAVDEFKKVYNENKNQDVKFISLGFSNVPIGTNEKYRDLQLSEASQLLGTLGKDNKEFLKDYCENNSNVVYIDGKNQSSGNIIQKIFGTIANKIIEEIDNVNVTDYVPADKFEVVTSKAGSPVDENGNEIKDVIVKETYKNGIKVYKVFWKNQKLRKGICKNWIFQVKAKDDYIGGNEVETNVCADIQFTNPLNNKIEKYEFNVPKVYVQPLKLGNLKEVGTIEEMIPVSFYPRPDFNINLPDNTLSKIYFKIKLSKGEHNISINFKDLINKNQIDKDKSMEIYEANNNTANLNKVKSSIKFDNKSNEFNIKNFNCEGQGEYYFVCDLKLNENDDIYIKRYISEISKDKCKNKEYKEKINTRRNEISKFGYKIYVRIDNSRKIELINIKLNILPDVV
ncbi:hypothetical protein Z957_11505 [Clostridium sp. K25]|uniref:VWA domain-containing protein n=1 Tax=Clostridium sp. K25 TaxID=1443109 RepID=UPI0004D80685|nr:VWA domain-containing protein [Clostridium sp. K25]KEI06492.1 hypothetical protein Z957_11505 [Clostridium sp. K25]